MADNYNYTVYENLYNYMNQLLYQVQTPSVYNNGNDTGQTGSRVSNEKSFADTFKNTVKQMGVPESMDAIFEEAAQRYNVPAVLLKAVGKAESGFNANAVSPAGAQGVMQLMPATAQSLGVTDPFDARSNIMGGAKYIAEKLRQYDGDVDLALAAYNAGSGNVAKYGGVPPFTETINYIKRIKEYMETDLTTGKTVETAQAAQEQTGISGASDVSEGLSSRSLTEVMTQFFMAKMQLQLQDRVNALGQSVMENDENTEKSIFL